MLTRLNAYDPELYMLPLWEGGTVYHESIMFIPNPYTKQTDCAPLLYIPDEILSLRSADLITEYEPDRDFTVKDGCICLTPDSRIPVWRYDDYYLASPAEISIENLFVPGRYVLFDQAVRFAAMQLSVTYTHSDRWEGFKPAPGKELIRTRAKLTGGRPLRIVYYGDSIMAGCDASGLTASPPNMPIFTELVTACLKRCYGYDLIAGINTSVPGADSCWGREQADVRAAAHHPDLVVVGFGMNDSGAAVSVSQFEENLRAVIACVRAVTSTAEFILITPSLPNPACQGWTNLQPYYQSAIDAIHHDTAGVAVVHLTRLHQYLLTKKRYDDMNGNGVNHPNDFFARLYAQAIVVCLQPSP